MQRLIKFRAWDKRKKEMIRCEIIRMTIKGTIRGIFGAKFYNDCMMDPIRYMDGREKDLILMQYTGLHDKDGVEIYEGDVVECCSDMIGTVFYYTEFASFQVRLLDTHIDLWRSGELKIIGNIWENKELFEEA